MIYPNTAPEYSYCFNFLHFLPVIKSPVKMCTALLICDFDWLINGVFLYSAPTPAPVAGH